MSKLSEIIPPLNPAIPLSATQNWNTFVFRFPINRIIHFGNNMRGLFRTKAALEFPHYTLFSSPWLPLSPTDTFPTTTNLLFVYLYSRICSMELRHRFEHLLLAGLLRGGIASGKFVIHNAFPTITPVGKFHFNCGTLGKLSMLAS